MAWRPTPHVPPSALHCGVKRRKKDEKELKRRLQEARQRWMVAAGLDACAASAAAALVSPIIAVIDVAVVENASGLRKLGEGMKHHGKKALNSPSKFFASREFHAVWALYAATYATANWLDSYSRLKHTDAHLAKFAATTLVNLQMGITKDHAFTQMFSVVAPHPFPLKCYALFTLRDCITMGASFSWTQDASDWLQNVLGMDVSKADLTSQLGCPSISQLFTTPLHLLAVDIYNRPVVSNRGRLLFVKREYPGTTAARVGRVGIAFGIGGVVNKMLVKAFNSI